MSIYKAFTCRIQGNPGKEDFLKSSIQRIADLSAYVFSLGKERWGDQKSLYHECRAKFPDIHSKHLQQFLKEYMPKGKRNSPKEKPLPPALILDCQNFVLNKTDATKYTNWWLRFRRINFPLRGKEILERMSRNGDPVSVKITLKDGKLWCSVSTSIETADKAVTDFSNSTGVDINSTCLVSSENSFYSTKRMLHVKREHRKNKMKGRNLKNQTRDAIHKLTRKLVSDLVVKGRDVLVLEDLKNLRRSSSKKLGTSKGRSVNHTVNSLPFYMFRSFLENKCSELGINVTTVTPEFTSKTCNSCGSLETERPTRNSFVCKSCGHNIHADLNAARNIRLRYTQSYGPPENLAPVAGKLMQQKPPPLGVG